MEEPLVSIVIPAFNRAHTLRRAIASVLAQEIADWELIVVDDGSSDGSADIPLSYNDPRIRVLRHERNRGAAAARNTGVGAARGRYIAFLDSDDEWLPGKLATQLAAMEKPSGAPQVSCTGFVLHREESGRYSERRPKADGSWFDTMLDGCYVSPGSTMMVRRDCFTAVGPLDEGLPRLEDWDWLLRCMERFSFDCLPMLGTVVHVSRRPHSAAVAVAIDRLHSQHAERVLRVSGPEGLRRFRASLAIEQAVAAVHERSFPSAVGHIGRAFARSPMRTTRFLARCAVRVF
ncbi:glycosyltransferase family 2 protein [Azospirillum thermophilum]|uniref:Glycosyl transferase n=1 Tax=Azospirillum thermophilum TaxID=2202148 RepID=A0A2S2D0J5_9PROT|nr:glycosyltransferase family 2 protein [Azospirillum thermophilum]AWK90283.1 glycosyl transferase [Azospirillum thermophilum]